MEHEENRKARERRVGEVIGRMAGLNGVEVGGKAFFALTTPLSNRGPGAATFAPFVMSKKPSNG
jgi:hypothetical protein